MVLIDTGMRIHECLTLEWTDVRLEPAPGAKHGYLTVRRRNAKNSKSRNVPLTTRVVEALRRRSNQQHSAIRNLLKMPTDFVLHSFRHTYGTRLGETGADAFTIMRLMGHSTVTMSQRYVHPSPVAMENAVSQMEFWKSKQLRGVGTNLGTVNVAFAVAS